MTEKTVSHQPEKNRFVIMLGDQEAVLDYRLSRNATVTTDATVNFTHTYVPPDLRGKGLAEALVRTGLKWARQNDYQIQASCWYVAKFLR